MKRRPNSPWIVVAMAFAMTLTPAKFRRRVRLSLLNSMARCARLVASPVEASEKRQDGPGSGSAADQFRQEIRYLEAENARLKHALEQAGAVPEILKGQGGVSLVPVDVSPLTAGTSIKRRLLLTEGRNLGIERGHSAVVGTALVGVVVQVSERAGELRLITDPEFRMRGRVDGTDIEGLVKGRAGELLFFEVASQDDQVTDLPLKLGQCVSSSPQSQLCPIPSVIGRIVEVERFGGLTRATLRPVVEARAVSSVVILRPSPEGSEGKPAAKSKS